MSEVIAFPDRGQITKQACAWIARIDAGLSDADRAELESWLERSSEHRESLIELSRLWDDMDMMSELADLFPLSQLRPRGRDRTRRILRLSPAFAALGLAIVAFLTPVERIAEVTRSTFATDGSYVTAVGEQLSIELVDGTVLTLNTDSRIQVRYTANRRAVVLERGEATFDVAEDRSRPFEVYAGRQIVQAIGTVFNVQLKPDYGLEVAVTEGRVRVLHRSRATNPTTDIEVTLAEPAAPLIVDSVLSAGQAIVVEEEISTLRRLDPEDIDIELAWQRGMLIFRGEPLETVLREVGRYTTAEFELADPSLATVRVGGYFRAGEVDGLLLALRENFGIRANRDGEQITLAAD